MKLDDNLVAANMTLPVCAEVLGLSLSSLKSLLAGRLLIDSQTEVTYWQLSVRIRALAEAMRPLQLRSASEWKRLLEQDTTPEQARRAVKAIFQGE